MIFGTCCCGENPCCDQQMRVAQPLRLQCDMVQYQNGERVVFQSFNSLMRWHAPTPSWLQTFTQTRWSPFEFDENGDRVYQLEPPFNPSFPGCANVGQDTIGPDGVFLSDDEFNWTASPRPTNSNYLGFYESLGTFGDADPESVNKRFVVGQLEIDFEYRQQDECFRQLADNGSDPPNDDDADAARLAHACGPIGLADCKVGMARTDHNYRQYFGTQYIDNPTGLGLVGVMYDPVNYGFVAKIAKWLTLTCNPVYGFGVFPYFMNLQYIDGKPWADFSFGMSPSLITRVTAPIDSVLGAAAPYDVLEGQNTGGLYEYTLTES